MRVAMLSAVVWRTPPRHYGPWERVTSLLTEALVKEGIDVTLFATADSLTRGKLDAVCRAGYEEDRSIDAKVSEYLHIANCFEKAGQFDLIHNQFDFAPLPFSRFVKTPVVTTIHGFSSPKIIPVYKKYNGHCGYISISDADRSPQLNYLRTIYHGIDTEEFSFHETHSGYLAYFGRIHPDKGTREAIRIAQKSRRKLIMAGIIQDADYFHDEVEPFIDGVKVHYAGSVGPQVRNEILGNAAALLHPINFDEPFGLSVVEAMACGTPVIAYRRGSMPELIDHGVNGFLATDIKEAAELVEEIDLLDRRVCRQTVQRRFSVQRMAREYIEVYREVINR